MRNNQAKRCFVSWIQLSIDTQYDGSDFSFKYLCMYIIVYTYIYKCLCVYVHVYVYIELYRSRTVNCSLLLCSLDKNHFCLYAKCRLVHVAI